MKAPIELEKPPQTRYKKHTVPVAVWQELQRIDMRIVGTHAHGICWLHQLNWYTITLLNDRVRFEDSDKTAGSTPYYELLGGSAAVKPLIKLKLKAMLCGTPLNPVRVVCGLAPGVPQAWQDCAVWCALCDEPWEPSQPTNYNDTAVCAVAWVANNLWLLHQETNARTGVEFFVRLAKEPADTYSLGCMQQFWPDVAAMFAKVSNVSQK